MSNIHVLLSCSMYDIHYHLILDYIYVDSFIRKKLRGVLILHFMIIAES